MKTPKSAQEIILETYAAYPTIKSCAMNIDTGACEYLTPDGKMCAIGRCLIEPGDKMLVGSLNRDDKWRIGQILWSDDLLKPEYRGHPPEFWADLQKWHDYKAAKMDITAIENELAAY
jgi:hypothetical protein